MIMGSLCCCFSGADFDEHGNPNSLPCRHCLCLSCLTSHFLHMYTAIFQSEDVHAIPSLASGATATAIENADGSACDTYRSPPRPLAYDDPRFSHFQRGGSLISRREKTSSYCLESEPLRRASNESNMDINSVELKKKCSQFEDKTVSLYSDPSVMKVPGENKDALPYHFMSIEEEDVCPTCLEEYSPDDPRIILECSHHFHLGCIYEWKERSDACPVCGKMMVFDEAT